MEKTYDARFVAEIIRKLNAHYAGEKSKIVAAAFTALDEDYQAGRGEIIDKDSLRTAWDRMNTNVKTGKSIKAQPIERFLRALNHQSIDDYIAATRSDGLTGSIVKKLRAAFSDDDIEVAEVLSQAGDEYEDYFHVGPIIEIRDFSSPGQSAVEKGIDESNVILKRTGIPVDVGDGLKKASIKITGADHEKYCVNTIEPDDVFDAFFNQVTLQLHSTTYSAVRCSDVEIYDNAKLGIDRQATRLRHGSLDPRLSRVPYCLTLFFILILEDQKVLFMRRRKDAPWYPNMVDISGGEQLFIEDFDAGVPFQRWMRRAIVEEYFPSSKLSVEQQETIAAQFVGTNKLYSIGYNVRDCSFPLFAICKSRQTEEGYRELRTRMLEQQPRGQADREGPIGILTIDECRELIETGSAQGNGISMREKGGGANISGQDTRSKTFLVKLDAEDMHPMTPFRLALLLDSVIL